jgi:predicted MFS family arabinose efflux permease
VLLALIPSLAGAFAGTLLTIIVWNNAGWLLLPAQQHRLLSTAAETGRVLVSLNASAVYCGLGLAGIVGGWVIDVGSKRDLGPAAAAIAAAALVVHLFSAGRRSRHGSTSMV